MNTRTHAHRHVVLALLLSACGQPLYDGAPPNPSDTPTVPDTFVPELAAGGILNTFHHPAGLGGEATTDQSEILARMEDEGPPAFRARVHGCRKMRYRTVGTVLSGLGVDLSAESGAGAMYRASDQALGAPNYEARIPESAELTTASASRLFDILVQAAPEIIEAMPSREECRVGSAGVSVFDESGACTRDGISCLLGEVASEEQVALCNEFRTRASTPEKGRLIAVASILAASMTCE